MKVDQIIRYKDLFLSRKKRPTPSDQLYKYESQYNWQTHWDIEAIDFLSSFDASLQSKLSGSLWGGSKNSGKETMSAMISSNKEFVRSAFRDLLSSDKDLGLRCDRFLFYCDEAFKSVKDHYFINHLHDRKLLSVYLTLGIPSQYCLFDYPVFVKMMTKLESRNIPAEFEIERYMKSMKAIHGILAKDEKWVDFVKNSAGEFYVDDTILAINEFAEFVANSSD